jgi:nucleoside-specific outer membrane channel protein Tsx
MRRTPMGDGLLLVVWTLAVFLACLGTCPAAGAASWGVTGVQLLHGTGYELGPDSRDIFTFEHASEWGLGSNFFFFDVTQPFDSGTDIYGEWYPRLSWSKLGLISEGTGLLRDVSFTASLNAGQGFRAYLAGVTLHLNVPGFTYLDLDVMAYDDRSDTDVTYIVTPAWDLPFAAGRLGCRFRGFVDLIGAEGERAQQLLAQPQLLVDLGRLWGREGVLFVGVEYQYWHNKYGVDGVTESLPQVMALWQF